MAADITRAIEAIWRIEAAKLVAGLARLVRDAALAEDLAQDALVAALDQWPKEGIPDRPGAWLMAVAKRRAVDFFRRGKLTAQKHEELARSIETLREDPDPAAALDDDIGDDLLGLIFTACHPLLTEEARVALTLRLVGGLTTEEIARAFLVPEATIAQRIVRAKRRLTEAAIPFEVPRGDERARRLPSVLEVVYAIFNEGYSTTSGEDWMRPQLCEEAMRLGRILAQLAPGDSEIHGLLALMELQSSRLKARSGPAGEPILLLDQDRSRWDQLLIRRGLAALRQAAAIDGARGPYALQAAIAACHALAPAAADTDWRLIAALYAALAQVMPSPVVEVNRAVALGRAFGAAVGLELADALMQEAALSDYHLLAAVRGDLLEKLGRQEEAHAEFMRAARLTRNAREEAVMLGRANSIMRTPGA